MNRTIIIYIFPTPNQDPTLHDRLQYTINYNSLRINYSLRSLVRGNIFEVCIYLILEYYCRILLSNITATYETCDISWPSDLKFNCVDSALSQNTYQKIHILAYSNNNCTFKYSGTPYYDKYAQVMNNHIIHFIKFSTQLQFEFTWFQFSENGLWWPRRFLPPRSQIHITFFENATMNKPPRQTQPILIGFWLKYHCFSEPKNKPGSWLLITARTIFINNAIPQGADSSSTIFQKILS